MTGTARVSLIVGALLLILGISLGYFGFPAPAIIFGFLGVFFLIFVVVSSPLEDHHSVVKPPENKSQASLENTQASAARVKK